MNNLKKVNNDILKDWFIFRETCIAKEENYNICFDEIYKKILSNTKKQNRAYVKRQIRKLDEKIIDYTVYLEEKNYRDGFCDGIKLLTEALYNNK